MTQLQNPTPLAMPDQADKSFASCPKGGNNAADQVKVTAVTHWTDKLFSFQTDRPPSFRFQSGEFAMIGLADNDGKAITRAYSIASPHWDDYLEFYSIIVPDGPLTSRLRHIQIGDDIILRPKTTGTLNLARLRDGKRLYLLATGTGFAPFASLIRDPETYERFDEVVLVHGCRTIAELGYSQKIVADSRAHPLIGEMVTAQLHYVPSVTRENFTQTGRITTLLADGKLASSLSLPPLDANFDRIVICGSIGLNQDIAAQLLAKGFQEGNLSSLGDYVIERAFVGDGI
ncbi:ferredoxin--NADP reductase [Alphaproteobacteria bacterium]|jgi:ferredoxin--NADP+ reductase|nr:ferredoxin--NADP reductase [Alphaproteobacteria bacterium]